MTTAILAMADRAAPDMQASAFRDLYEEHARGVYLTALRVTGNPADAEDVLQTVFMRVLDTRPDIDTSRSPGAYLRRAAANASIDLIRRKKTRRETSIDAPKRTEARPYAVVAMAPRDPSAGGDPDRVLLKERLRQALARLSEENAELFVLCYLEGYSYDELAELLDLERGTVASRLHRIRAKLQEELSR